MRVRVLTLLPVLGLLPLCGCRKAAVEPHVAAFETRLTVGQPAYLMRPEGETEAPWYRSLQIVFEQRPADEKELETQLNDRKPVAAQAEEELLHEIQRAVQGRRIAADKWSLSALTIGRTKRTSELGLSAEIVLTGLYAKRPVIAFNDVPLDMCVGKLARDAGIMYATPRGHNPFITWSKTDVSAAEALDEILPAHGYEHKYVSAARKANLRLAGHPSRAAFVEAAVREIVEVAGKELNAARPAIAVTAKETPPAAPAEPEKKAVPAPPPPPKPTPSRR